MNVKSLILAVSLILTGASATVALADCLVYSGSGSGLPAAARDNDCVYLTAGVYLVSESIVLPAGHVLWSDDEEDATILASPTFPRDGRSLIVAGGAWDTTPQAARRVSGITLDGAGVVMNVVGVSHVTLDRVTIRSGACAGVTVAGPHVVVTRSTIEHNSWPTYVPSVGYVDCAQNPQGGNVWGAGVYLAPNSTGPTILTDNVIRDNHGPGIDAWQSGGLTIRGLTCSDNRGWACVHLYDAHDVAITRSVVVQATTVDATVHPECYQGAPVLGAAVRVCGRSRSVAVTDSTLAGGYSLLAGPETVGVTTSGNTMIGTVRAGAAAPPPPPPPAPASPAPSQPPTRPYKKPHFAW